MGADDQGLPPRCAHVAEATLRRLGTDYLDLYYLHAPDQQVTIEETLAAMAEAVMAGKVRYGRCPTTPHGRWPRRAA